MQVYPQMFPCCLSVGCVAPFYLIESGHRITQVWNVEVSIYVMVREMAQRLSIRRGFDCREG
jgi:hypothetical protein